MKRFGKLFLCFGVAFCILLSACSCGVEETDTDTSDDTQETSDTGNKTEDTGTVYEDKTVIEHYLPENVRSYYETAFTEKSDKFKYCMTTSSTDHSLHSLQDSITISDCAIKKISIAVYKTGALDSDGKLVFSLFVHESSLTGLKSQALREYKIKITPADYGLSENATVMRFIDIDVTEFNIVLAEDETLAMFASTDTVIPMRVTVADPINYKTDRNEVALPLVENFPQAQSFFTKVGTSDLKYNASMLLLYDFEWEKTYTAEEQQAADEAKAEYEELKTLLGEKYSGKYVSILGDSISTFDGVANNTQYNSTIGDNLMYYSHSNNPHTWENTYWGRLINDLDMKLCVNNSWASSRVYGRPTGKVNSGDTVELNYRDSAPVRATELHNADGTTPDLIIMYMGINDLHSNASPKVPFGDLYDILKGADASEYNALIDEWFEEVLQKTGNGSVLTAGTTYTSFEQAYALALYRMTEKYSNADVLCLGLENNASAAFTTEKQLKFNLVIKAISEYFGATFADPCGDYSEVTQYNMHNYAMDIGCTHPNSLGHAAMERLIMRTLADNIKKNK